MELKSKLKIYLTTLYLILCFYCFGALIIENDVNYSTWHFISDESFPMYHQQLENSLGLFFRFPLTLLLITNILFVWWHPKIITKAVILLALALFVYILTESFLVQVPLHNELKHVKTDEIITRLITTHQMFRLPAEIIWFLCNVFILFKIISNQSQKFTFL